MYDVIIIGGGPAGLTAAVYGGRRALKTLVLTRDIGGQATSTFEIENFPGISHTSGIDLATTMKKQAENFKAEIRYEEVKKITKVQDIVEVETLSSTYKSQTLIIATGKKPRELNIPGEEEFKGRGVSYCATCDMPFFKNKIVAVTGGGNSAIDAALLASKIASKVYVIHRSQFCCEQILIEKMNSTKNIEILLGEEVAEISGQNIVKSINLKSGKKIDVDGIFVEIGFITDRTLVQDFVDLNDKHQVVVNNKQETSVPGVFAAGDLTDSPYKQIVVAAGEGAKAALSAYDFIQKKLGKKGITGDWH